MIVAFIAKRPIRCNKPVNFDFMFEGPQILNRWAKCSWQQIKLHKIRNVLTPWSQTVICFPHYSRYLLRLRYEFNFSLNLGARWTKAGVCTIFVAGLILTIGQELRVLHKRAQIWLILVANLNNFSCFLQALFLISSWRPLVIFCRAHLLLI